MSQPDLLVERVEWDDVGGQLRDEMLHLGLAMARPCPFFTPEFIDSYLVHNEWHASGDMEPFMFTVRTRAGELVGALPLKRVRNRQLGGYHQVEFVVATEVDLPGLIVRPSHEAAVASSLVGPLTRELRRASTIDFVNLSEASPLRRAVLGRLPWFARVQRDPGMPISSIPLTHDSVASYFGELSKRMRSNVSRLARRVAATGELEVISVSSASPTSTPETLADLFAVYLDIEDRSWKRRTEASLRRHQERVAMYDTLHADADHVEHRVEVLLCDGLPIAGLVSVVFGPTVFLLETCYDESYAECSPSNLLILLSIDRAISTAATEVALHGHFDYYKHRWMAQSMPTEEIRIVRRGSIPDIRSSIANFRRRRHADAEPEAQAPAGQRVNTSPLPESTVADVLERLSAAGGVERSSHEDLADRLPFDLS